MTPRQIELARHALGLDGRRVVSYRNRFIAGRDHADFAEWMAMVEQGDATRSTPMLHGGSFLFELTGKGAEQALLPNEKLDPEDFS